MTDSVVPVVGRALFLHPVALGAVVLLLTVGAHVVLSILVERRSITLKDDYPAVLIGDPLLAVAAMVGSAVVSGDYSWVARPLPGAVLMGALVAFGASQMYWEYATGRYSAKQLLSPSKLWHQFINYPAAGYLAFSAVISGITDPAATPAATAVILSCVFAWALLVVDAIRHPRLGHSHFHWPHLNIERQPGAKRW